MVDMSDLADTVSEAIDKAEEGGGSNLNGLIALSVAVVATFTALCNIKGGNIGQAMQQAQANVVDGWAYYQAKGTKLNIAESARDMLRVQADITPGLSPEARALLVTKIADYDAKIAAYEREKGDIKRDTEAQQRGVRPARHPRRSVRHGGGDDVDRDRADRDLGADQEAALAVRRVDVRGLRRRAGHRGVRGPEHSPDFPRPFARLSLP